MTNATENPDLADFVFFLTRAIEHAHRGQFGAARSTHSRAVWSLCMALEKVE